MDTTNDINAQLIEWINTLNQHIDRLVEENEKLKYMVKILHQERLDEIEFIKPKDIQPKIMIEKIKRNINAFGHYPGATAEEIWEYNCMKESFLNHISQF